MKAANYELSDKSKVTEILDSLVFSYINSSGNKDNIKIEINYGLSIHILDVQKCVVNDGLHSFEVAMLNKIELYATKITALINRGTARDLFDVNNMIIENIISEDEKFLLKKCIIFYSVLTNNKEDLFKLEKIIKIDNKMIKTGLYPMLKKTSKFDLDFSKKTVIMYLNNLLELNESEEGFVHEFYIGKLRLELLFEQDDIISRLMEHPMLIWKLKHIKEHLAT